jgi:hypothetical protein
MCSLSRLHCRGEQLLERDPREPVAPQVAPEPATAMGAPDEPLLKPITPRSLRRRPKSPSGSWPLENDGDQHRGVLSHVQVRVGTGTSANCSVCSGVSKLMRRRPAATAVEREDIQLITAPGARELTCDRRLRRQSVW